MEQGEAITVTRRGKPVAINRLLDYLTRPGEADRQRNGSAGQRQAPPSETGGRSSADPVRQAADYVLRRPSLSLYLDTSALVKLLVDEPDSDLANQAYDDFPAASTSAIARLEATSALARMRSGGRLSGQTHRTALDDLDDLWRDLQVHAVTDPADRSCHSRRHRARAARLRQPPPRDHRDLRRRGTGNGRLRDRELRAAVGEYGFARSRNASEARLRGRQARTQGARIAALFGRLRTQHGGV